MLIADSPAKVRRAKRQVFKAGPKIPFRQKIVMVKPDHFEIDYVINNFMADENGQVKKVDVKRAGEQWIKLLEVYQHLGFEVSVLEAVPGLPDMVFAANQSLPYWDIKNGGGKSVLMSQMAHRQRRPEVIFFEKWYRENGYEVKYLKRESWRLEGMGDVLQLPSYPFFLAGMGPRTQFEALEELSLITGYDVVPLNLVHPDYYHLDTCLSIIDNQTCAFVKEAFDEASLELIHESFDRLIPISIEENFYNFAANCHSPDGKNIILHHGAKAYSKELKRLGFQLWPVDTSEFMKSGGSVFCLKAQVF